MNKASRFGAYGWKPDLPGQLPHLYAAPLTLLGAMPPHSDLRPQCPPIVNQGQLGSCTANAGAAAVQFVQMKEKKRTSALSRLYIYYNTRDAEGTAASDAGASISDTIAALRKWGAPPETDWAYDITKFSDKPPPTAYAAASADLVIESASVAQDLQQMIGCLVSGYPIDIGFTVYDSFESDEVAKTGIVPMPDLSKENLLGGHSVLIVGHDDPSRRFTLRNSWGEEWGDRGYFYMPYEYLLSPNLSSDFQTIQKVSDLWP
jgi:C1A family cysteine protease